MFDQRTRQFILSVPEILGFENTELPELLSQTYLELAGIRLQGATVSPDSEIHTQVNRLRELASRLSVFASLAPPSLARTASFFVAGTSFQILARLREGVQAESDEKLDADDEGSRLTALTVPDLLSATLLFLAAGYPADAGEMARNGFHLDEQSSRAVISNDIRWLALGNFRAILNSTVQVSDNLTLFEAAEAHLWNLLHKSSQSFAAAALGERDLTEAVSEALAIADKVIELSVRKISLDTKGADETESLVSAYPAPLQVAVLLRSTFDDSPSRLLVNIPAPVGPPPADWENFIRRRASDKPYIWENHRIAINKGLLNQGTSGVITYPTGAGKSTIAQLKTAAAAQAGKRIVYLVPTLALVAQVEAAMRDLLEQCGGTVEADLFEDSLFSATPGELTGDVLVMTPERCLLWLGLTPSSFADLGLIVFDECHLIHGDKEHLDPRSLDAMLCLLSLLDTAPEADVLLMSAMIANSEELAGWLNAKFSKTVVVSDEGWKPTRQARGCLVFSGQELDGLRHQVLDAWSNGNSIPQHALHAQPLGVFALEQLWKEDQVLLAIPLITGDLQLTGKVGTTPWGKEEGQLNLNSIEAASRIAAQAAAQGLKTIVFVHSTKFIVSAVKRIAKERAETVPLDAKESDLAAACAIELGGSEFVYLPLSDAGGHFGTLLHFERELVEHCFRRPDGIRVLVATSTLAQGMNLPADLVIVARTSGRTKQGETRRVATHELLNAAGRAGRAGLAAHGIVLLIPDYIVEEHNNTIAGPVLGRLLQEVLSQDDRCLTVTDPCEVLLDKLTIASSTLDGQVDSLLVRLPVKSADVQQPDEASAALTKTLAAYHAERAGLAIEFQSKVEMAVARRVALFEGVEDSATYEVCRASGLSAQSLKNLFVLLENPEIGIPNNPLDWYALIGTWIKSDPDISIRLRLEYVGKNPYEAEAVKAWIHGQPFMSLQKILLPDKKLGYLEEARLFARQSIREIAYIVGLIGQIIGISQIDEKESIAMSASKASALLKAGVDTVEKLILLQIKRPEYWSRVKVHLEAQTWLKYVETNTNESEPIGDVIRRVRRGVSRYKSEVEAQ